MKLIFECDACGKRTPLPDYFTQHADDDEEKARLKRDLVAARVLIGDLRQAVDSATSGYMRFLRRLEAIDPAFQQEPLTEENIPWTSTPPEMPEPDPDREEEEETEEQVTM